MNTRHNQVEGDHKLKDKTVLNLMGLIEDVTGKLRECIKLLDGSFTDDGLQQLISVISLIDTYTKQTHDDPLLVLLPLDPENIRTRLRSIKSELSLVVEAITSNLL